MTPQQIEATRQALITTIFKAAYEGDKATMYKAFRQKYNIEELYNKPNPESPTGITKVRRKVIKAYFKNVGEIVDPSGTSVIDAIIETGNFLFAVHVLQEEQFGILSSHPLDAAKRCFLVKLKPKNFALLIEKAHDEVPAQITQRRGFMRRLTYGQPIHPEVDKFLQINYPDLMEELLKFRENNRGLQMPVDFYSKS